MATWSVKFLVEDITMLTAMEKKGIRNIKYLTIMSILIFGYISNIFLLFSLDFSDDIGTEEIIRWVGVALPPIGIVAGYVK